MPDQNQPKSLRQLAFVSGTTPARLRAAVEDGLILPWALGWADVLALRAFIPTQSIVLAGETVPRNETRATTPRSRNAVTVVRKAVEDGNVGPDSVLIVGRTSASIHESLEASMTRTLDLPGDGALMVFPVGQWWSEVRWRAGA